MIEAMYGVEFVAPGDFGYGVVIFETGKILGGDSSWVYIGNYEVQGGNLKATVKVTNDRGILPFVFPGLAHLKEVTLHGEGTIAHDKFTLRAYVKENPQVSLDVKFTRRAELP